MRTYWFIALTSSLNPYARIVVSPKFAEVVGRQTGGHTDTHTHIHTCTHPAPTDVETSLFYHYIRFRDLHHKCIAIQEKYPHYNFYRLHFR